MPQSFVPVSAKVLSGRGATETLRPAGEVMFTDSNGNEVRKLRISPGLPPIAAAKFLPFPSSTTTFTPSTPLLKAVVVVQSRGLGASTPSTAKVLMAPV